MSEVRILNYLRPHGWVQGGPHESGSCSNCNKWTVGTHTYWKRINGTQWKMLCPKCGKKEADVIRSRREKAQGETA
jgi:predicted RNA-binding Zn-ribbon protein involved in translation (DUF1610 family)